MGMPQLGLCVFLLSALFTTEGVSGNVVGCGGLIQASKEVSQLKKTSEGKLDYSSFSVEIQNEEGLVKEQTQCAPNGYYFLPVDHKGKVILSVKAPEGWNFEAEKVEVVVDENSCNGGKDVNFVYSGFSLRVQVLGSRGVGAACESGAPSGVAVSLSGETLKEPIVALTASDGSYHFPNLLPGAYDLSASHDKWRIETLGTPKVDVSWGGTKAPDLFRVAGYDLSGSVVSQGKPVPGVAVFLFSTRLKKLANCPLGPGSPSPLPDRKPLCHSITDESGTFSFPEVFCGEYQLVAQYLGQFTAFEVSPELMNVVVSHNSTVTQEPFNILGFSIGGSVVDSVGAGVAGAEVYLDGKLVTSTDSKGRYSLEKMTTGTYSLAAKKEHFYFADVSNIEVGPSTGSLPPITSEKYDICARVTVDEDSSFERERRVTLTPSDPALASPEAKITDATGLVCFQVVPGEYELLPHTTAAEVSAGLLFEPKSSTVKLVARPLTLNTFEQAHLSVSGYVHCIEECDERVKVTLSQLPPSVPKKGAPVIPTSDLLNWTQSVDPRTNTFTFERVQAGRYQLNIKKETREVTTMKTGRTMDTDEYCWDNNGTTVIEVSDTSIEGLSFRQKGFRLVMNITVEDTFDIADATDFKNLRAFPGRNEFCMERAGDYQVMFMDGCYFYGFFSLTWSTHVPYHMTLDPELYKMKGWVYVDSRKFKWANNISDHAFSDFYGMDGNRRQGTFFLYPEKPAVPSKGEHVLGLEIRYFGAPHEEGFVEPYHDGALHENFKSADDFARELEEEKKREKKFHLEQGRRVLKEQGYTEDRIEDLEEDLEEKQKQGLDVESILDLVGLSHLKVASPESQQGVVQPEHTPSLPDAGMDEDEEAANPLFSKGVKLKEKSSEPTEKGETEASGGEEGGQDGAGGEVASEEASEHGQIEESEGKEESDNEGNGAESFPEDDEESEDVDEDEDEDEEDEEIAPQEYTPPEDDRPWPPPVRILFYPKRRYYKVPQFRCPPMVEPFEGRPGVYLNGTIEPPISGVNVTVVADTDSVSSGWKAGDVVEWGLSRDGVFIVGPLYDDATYHTEASKEGFVFKALGKNSFEAEQLASISVHVAGTPTKAPKGSSEASSAASSLVLSLTGEGSFYKNIEVAPGDSRNNHSFLGLYPGSYSLRPILKEYEFNPASQQINLLSGQQLHASFSATRVAFSVSGKVLSLLGKAEEGVTVEARTKEGAATQHYETAVTNDRGRYRLRGLLPGVAYSIRVQIKGLAAAASSEGPVFEQASPKSRDLTMNASDVADVDFVVFDHAPSLLTGTVSGPKAARWQPHIRVQVVHHSDRTRVEQSTALPISRFFEFKELPPAKYIVRLAFGLPEQTHSFVADEAFADLSAEKVVHVGKLKFEAKKRHGNEAQECNTGPDGSKQCKW